MNRSHGGQFCVNGSQVVKRRLFCKDFIVFSIFSVTRVIDFNQNGVINNDCEDSRWFATGSHDARR